MRQILIIIGILMICTGSCSAGNARGDELYSDGLEAYAMHNYRDAIEFFNQSLQEYDREGNGTAAREALLRKNRASWMLLEMGLNRSLAEEVLISSFPNLSQSDLARFLEPGESVQTESDGETRYFIGIANNVAFHNKTYMQTLSREQNHSAFFDEVFPLIAANTTFDGWYGNPRSFMVNSSLSIPREMLPDNGTLNVWIPLPVETASQRNITIISLQPEQYVALGPTTTGDLGQVYFEIPLVEMTDSSLNISADYRFSTYEQRFEINPQAIGTYDTKSDLYQRYTGTQADIEITPDITELAELITGTETNPYRKAKLIYEYIITTYPYSTVPHTFLAASGIPESTYLFDTGFGDCGTQSALFAALCRAAGIPARSAGGYQLVPGIAGPHFWAEFYLPAYGWIPADVTIAESADWAWNRSDEERREFKEYFFGNLDPYRYTIQNDLDIPFSPDPGDSLILKMVHQTPAVVCNESREDTELMGLMYRNITFSETG